LGIARVNGLFERQSGANRARLESGDRVWMCDPCQAEEGLRGRHRLISPVVAEHELAPTLVLEKARFYWCKLGGADAPPNQAGS